ncbi:AAA family ATPase, partial [Arthrospira platensis SPKY1]|nr:AAA family ATPase [Arthrospira platensis SPKY1]
MQFHMRCILEGSSSVQSLGYERKRLEATSTYPAEKMAARDKERIPIYFASAKKNNMVTCMTSVETPAVAAPKAMESVNRLRTAVEATIRGKSDVVDRVICCLLASGHVLVEDLPGLGKTTLAHCLARAIDCHFSRIQFTSDLLPSDILGVSIYDEHAKAFTFRPGPIFANIVLAD